MRNEPFRSLGLGWVATTLASAGGCSTKPDVLESASPLQQPSVSSRFTVVSAFVSSDDPPVSISSAHTTTVTVAGLSARDSELPFALSDWTKSSSVEGSVERHPGILIDGLPGYPNAVVRDGVMHHGWDNASVLRMSMPNDWIPGTHGPSTWPGDCRNGAPSSTIPGFPGVFDRDLFYRTPGDSAPLVPVALGSTGP